MIVLVTGATDGLGQAVARDLAQAGHEVLVHGRDPDKLAQQDFAAGAYQADFASLEEVKRLADEVPEIDVLVNNAGIGTTLPGDGKRMESVDGHELRFAVNYLAPFCLTERLRPRIGQRIVNVSSAGQMPIDFDDVMLERDYDATQAYCQSKLAQVMHTFDLAELLGGVTATCLHPATYMPTKIVLHARGDHVDTLEEGAAATERLAVDPALEGVTGKYFMRTQEAAAHAQAYDADARRRLRELSLSLCA